MTQPKLTRKAKELVLLNIIDAMGGRADCSLSGDWISWFCEDQGESQSSDTFNRCHEKGWLHTTHDTFFDNSTTTITETGREALRSKT